MSTSPPSSSTSCMPRYPERQSLPGSAERNTPAIVDALRPHLLGLVDQIASTYARGERRPSSSSSSSSAAARKVRVLELASGPGAHVVALATNVGTSQHEPNTLAFEFQPTEADQYLCRQINEAVAEAPTPTTQSSVLPAKVIDFNVPEDWTAMRHSVRDGTEGGQTPAFDAVLGFNLLHITPFEVTHTIFEQLDARADLQREGLPLLDPSHGLIAFYGAFKEHEDDELSESNAKFDADIRSRNPAFGIRSVDAIQEVAHRHGYGLAQRISMPANNWILIFRPLSA